MFPTGASWQVLAHPCQRATLHPLHSLDCLRGTGALRTKGGATAPPRRLAGSHRLLRMDHRQGSQACVDTSPRSVPGSRSHHGPARTAASLRAVTPRPTADQTSRRWSLTIAVTDPWRHDVVKLVATLPRWARRRVRMIVDAEETPARNLLAQGLANNRGKATALIFPGDVWATDTVAILSSALAARAVVYADEDVVGADGFHRYPRLKPEFSPDFLLSSPYVGRPLAFGQDITDRMPSFVADDIGSLEHEVALSACAAAHTVTHVPEVLCHRSEASEDSPFTGYSKSHIEESLRRQGHAWEVRMGTATGTFSVLRQAEGRSATILIPLRDEPRFLRSCVDSITTTTRHDDVEILLIDNGSSDPETLTLLERFALRTHVRVLRDDRPFNWPQLNNRGVQSAEETFSSFSITILRPTSHIGSRRWSRTLLGPTWAPSEPA